MKEKETEKTSLRRDDNKKKIKINCVWWLKLTWKQDGEKDSRKQEAIDKKLGA